VEWISRPDQAIRQVWTSPTRYELAFRPPRLKRRFDRIQREENSLFAALPKRQPNTTLLLRMNEASKWYPRSILWIVLGVIALAVRRTRRGGMLVALALAALLVILFNALGQVADPRFSLPVAPAFVFFGACALFGRRARATPR
jgi:hypothetical protein